MNLKVLKLFHQLIHPDEKLYIVNILVLVAIIQRAQEIAIVINNDWNGNFNLSPIIYIIKLFFVLNSISETQLTLILIAFFILHALFLIFIILQCFFMKNEIIRNINSIYLFHYLALFQIPSIYGSILFIYNTNYCLFSEICINDISKIILILLCAINCCITLLITILIVYFGRAEKLMNQNNVQLLNFSYLYRAILQLILIIAIILSAINQLEDLRFSFIFIKLIINIIIQFKNPQDIPYLYIDLVIATILFVLQFKLSIFELFISLSFMLVIANKMSDLIFKHYICEKNFKNIIILQILQQNILKGDKQSKFILGIMKKNHNCLKCKSFNQITECTLRKMSNIINKNQNLNTLLYSTFVANNFPLKALIKIILQQPQDVYFSCSFQNLSVILNQRSKQAQLDASHKNSLRNANEHSMTLDVQSAYLTSNSSFIIFPYIIETINGKIKFWSKLINGYQTLDEYLDESIIISQLMMKCKLMMEERFDLKEGKLLNAAFTDIISMRILQLYYSGVYINTFQAYQLEKQIEDLLKSERFKQDESLDNLQLIQNRLIILKSSLIRKRGELVNLNQKQLSQFLGEKEEELKNIKHCNQLMPEFISNIHDNLMDNYLRRGVSKLMIHGEQTFCQTISGYVEQCNINLFNFFDDKNDFIINMIITKQQSNNEIVIFGVDGKILGFTKIFFDEVIKKKLEYYFHKSNSKSDDDSDHMDIKLFLKKNPLIQFYIPSITEQVDQLRYQIQSSANYLLNNLKSSWIVPSNHTDCLINSQLVFTPFKKKIQSSQQNFKSFKSYTYSRYSGYTNNSQVDQYDESDFNDELKSKITVDNIPLIMLHPQVEEQLKKMIENSEALNKKTQMALFYSLQFKVLNYKGGNFGYFLLMIKDFKAFLDLNQYNYPTTYTGQSIYNNNQIAISISKEMTNSDLQVTNQDFSDVREKLEVESQLIKEIRNMNNYSFVQRDFSQDQSDYINNSKIQIKSSDRSNLFDSNRWPQPQFAYPKLFEKFPNDDFQDMERDMKIIKDQRGDIEDDEQENIKIESNSQSVQKNSNILKKFKTNQQEKKEIVDFASNPSRTSTNSTSKESMLIVQQLYTKTQLIVPLRKISFLLFLICSGVLVCNITNVQLISSSLIQQTTQVDTLRKPQNINYFYSSAMLQEWIQYLQSLNLIFLSSYLNNQNIATLDGMYVYARGTLVDLAIQVPMLAAQTNYSTTFNMKFVINGEIVYQTYPLEYVYEILYETAEKSYRNNKGASSYNYTDMLSTGLIRVNLWNMMDLHNKLIIAITNDTISLQNVVQSYFLSVMMAELFTILFIICIQLRYWLFIDQITKQILFLVSRLSENQALDQINRLQMIKEYLENQNSGEWKIINFGEIMYGFAEKKAKKVILKSTVDQNLSGSVRSVSSLYSRIQNTSFLNRTNVFLTFVLVILWTIFLMAGFLIHMQKNNSFQPSLTVTLKFVQFRHNMDSLSILAGIIKSEPTIPNYNLSFINQTLACQLLIQYRDNLQPLMNEIAQVILETANQNGAPSRFDKILNNNLCESLSSSVLTACDLSGQNLAYSSKDSYLDIISNGAFGYTAALVKFISSEYDYEIQNLQYSQDVDDCLLTIQAQPYQNFVLQYFTDIQTAMRQFLVLFQEDNTSIANSIIQLVQLYYYLIGTILFIYFIIQSMIWVIVSQNKIQTLRQILVLIPADHILNTNVRSQARAIHSMLY